MGYNWMPYGFPLHSQHHKPLQARPSFSGAATTTSQWLYLRSAALHQAFLFTQLYHHVSVPSGVQKTSQHELVPWAPAVHSNVDVVGLVSPSCHHTQVCHFSLATHYSSNQARLLNRSPLKCYDSMNIITKEYNILLNFQHPKSHY